MINKGPATVVTIGAINAGNIGTAEFECSTFHKVGFQVSIDFPVGTATNAEVSVFQEFDAILDTQDYAGGAEVITHVASTTQIKSWMILCSGNGRIIISIENVDAINYANVTVTFVEGLDRPEQ